MTIGIGACGPNAGRAVFEALRAAERVGRGAIGGFATYAAITADGRLLRHETQRGGSQTLFIDGESTGVDPSGEVASATAAAVISSGPERPTPLSQFLTADPKGGLVSGHRLPNGISVDGRALNVEVLEELIAGRTAREAVDRIIGRNPEADVGLIAVDLRGGAWSRNSSRVQRRPDLGHGRLEDGNAGAAVEVLHNAIRPHPSLAVLVAAVAMEAMVGAAQPAGWITINAGVPLVLGEAAAVHCDRTMVAQKVITTDPTIVKGPHACAAIYIHSAVIVDGTRVGLTMFEPIVTVIDGICTTMSGQTTLRMSFCAPS
jgi:hypothetical protein